MAQPGTLTGSIGVAFGKWNYAMALKAQGVSVSTISFGKNAAIESPYRDYSKEQSEFFTDRIDR